MAWRDQVDAVLETCVDTFGEPATYTPSGGSPVEVLGIYDDLYEAVDPQTGAIITSTQPVLGIKDDHLPDPPQQDDTVTVRGVTYRVKEVQTDGQGGSKLFLHRL